MSKDIIERPKNSTAELSINGRIYNLTSPPDYEKDDRKLDPLVKAQRDNLLQQINLNELNDNLYLSVELLFVAYNGVAGAQGGKLQADINKIMGDLALVCNDCIVTMDTFHSKTGDIISLLGETYSYLVTGKEKMAILRLKRCGDASEAMSVKSNELSLRFIDLQKRSTAAKSNTILEEASENEKKEAAAKAIRELESKLKTEQANQGELTKQAGEMQGKYDEAQKKEKKEGDKAFALSILSAIAGTVTTILSVGVGAYSATKKPSDVISNPANKEDAQKIDDAQKEANKKKSESDEAEKKLAETKGKITAAQTNLEGLKKAVADLQEKIKGSGDKTAKPDEDLQKLKDEHKKKENEITELNKQINDWEADAKKQKDDCEAKARAYGVAAAALQKLNENMSEMAAKSASAEERIHKEKMEYLKKKLELEDEKRKSLIAMTAFAENIKNSRVEEGNAEVSVNALHTAVEALGKIIGTLTTASLFWKQMSEFCKRMIDSGIQTKIADMQEGLDPEERIEEYQEVNFMMSFLTYMCQWVALNGLSADYVISAGKAQEKCKEYIAKSPTIAEARKIAPALAKNLNLMLQEKIEISNKISSDLVQENARLKITANLN
jgi:peptidoglycan hydrolase CwlO-like protein